MAGRRKSNFNDSMHSELVLLKNYQGMEGHRKRKKLSTMDLILNDQPHLREYAR